MEKVTVFESIIRILNLIASVPFFIEILILTIILLIAMLFFYFKKSKKGKVTCLIIYIVTLFLLPISHLSFFAQTIDKVIENYMKILYFPSCYVYMVLLIVTDVSVFFNIIKNLKKTKRKWYVAFDLVYFFVFQFLFFLIIRTVVTENIDIFERTELYSNPSLMSTLQISSYLFWIRFGIKFVAFIVNRLSDKKENVSNKINDNKTFSQGNVNQSNVVIEDKKVDSILNINNNAVKDITTFNIGKTEYKNKDNISKDTVIPNNNSEQEMVQSYEENSTNKTEEFNNMNSFNIITEIKNSNKKNIKLLSDDLIQNNIIESKKLNNNIERAIEEQNISKTEVTTNYNLELKEEDELDNYFDDFYE